MLFTEPPLLCTTCTYFLEGSTIQCLGTRAGVKRIGPNLNNLAPCESSRAVNHSRRVGAQERVVVTVDVARGVWVGGSCGAIIEALRPKSLNFLANEVSVARCIDFFDRLRQLPTARCSVRRVAVACGYRAIPQPLNACCKVDHPGATGKITNRHHIAHPCSEVKVDWRVFSWSEGLGQHRTYQCIDGPVVFMFMYFEKPPMSSATATLPIVAGQGASRPNEPEHRQW